MITPHTKLIVKWLSRRFGYHEKKLANLLYIMNLSVQEIFTKKIFSLRFLFWTKSKKMNKSFLGTVTNAKFPVMLSTKLLFFCDRQILTKFQKIVLERFPSEESDHLTFKDKSFRAQVFSFFETFSLVLIFCCFFRRIVFLSLFKRC